MKAPPESRGQQRRRGEERAADPQSLSLLPSKHQPEAMAATHAQTVQANEHSTSLDLQVDQRSPPDQDRAVEIEKRYSALPIIRESIP